ncbi:alpha-glucosidase (family GH31 glycosyl hydrolase) [Microbacterium immunditiarum]|uniref:Alpha-glucosidase (Family GH31 glycosyl hydrolase) n=2 Tax=Microbacterium immunditiarum TaxID=337480 RepID=A0A7Y9GQ13_9MICO|nr:alpha-glucosidase (family GH31 glycosyl hydrolase) [Microbacterium immunditiarum]
MGGVPLVDERGAHGRGIRHRLLGLGHRRLLRRDPRSPSRDRTPWNIAERTGDERVLPLFRRYTKLRERLVPYLERSAAATIATDRPLMRPLFFEWPDDPAVWTAPTQWLLGDDILVAPVLEEGATEWSVYLPETPEGEWADAWTGDRITGGGTGTVPTPIDRIPVFVRGDSIDELLALFRE